MSLPLTREEFDFVVQHLNAASSPGAVWAEYGATKGDVISNAADVLFDAVNSKLMGAPMDPVRVFVKNEPHKREKLEQGRYRLICSLSVADEIVHRHLFGEEVDLLSHLATHPSVPLCCHWTSTSNQCNEKIAHIFQDGPIKSSDVSGNDWSVSPSFYRERAGLYRERGGQTNERRAIACEQLLDVKFSFSDGTMAKLSYPGIMLSGLYMTTVWNTVHRIVYGALVGQNPLEMMVCGDDVIERPIDAASYSRLGLDVQWFDDLEFLGFKIDRTGNKLSVVNFNKTMNNLAHHYSSNDVRQVVDSLTQVWAPCEKEIDVLRRHFGVNEELLAEFRLRHLLPPDGV